jgi:hypothetical protein
LRKREKLKTESKRPKTATHNPEKGLPSAPVERCSLLIFTAINLVEIRSPEVTQARRDHLGVFLASPDFNGIIPQVLMSS